MSRNAFVPMEWLTAPIGGEALRTLILISCHADARSGECWPTNGSMAKALGKTSRAIQFTLTELREAGMISILEGQGKKRRIRIESESWYSRPMKKAPNHEEKLHGSTMKKTFVVQECNHEENLHPNHEENLHGNHEENLHGPNKNTIRNTPIEHSSGEESVSEESKPTPPATTTTTQNLEPFESGNPAPLPNVRNAVEPFRPRLVELRPTQFKPETRDRIMAVLGHDAEQFARKITQEQADAGFPDWILDEAKKNKTPARLAFHLLKTAWRPGWVSPKAEEEAKRAARRARLEALR